MTWCRLEKRFEKDRFNGWNMIGPGILLDAWIWEKELLPVFSTEAQILGK